MAKNKEENKQEGLSISELLVKWAKEKDYYEDREVGTGVQIFVKDVLKSPDIFALKVGLNSTKSENRKNEFLEEKGSKDSRRPDITIYITPDIIIPVEVEKYNNINAGIGQLLQYQIDLDKKYGILTDGYTWRFYNNNIYTEYTQKTLFGKTDVFLEFWQEYIKPEKYYLSFFEKLGQRSLLQEVEELPVEENRQIFFGDITRLIDSFKKKLDIEGYLKDLPEKEKRKTAIEITYAYVIQFILYKTLVDNRFDNFPEVYKNKVEAMHRSLKKNSFKDILGIIDGISADISKNIYRPFAKEQEFIREKLMELYHEPINELHDVSPWLDIFVFIKKYNFAEIRNEIFGYIYENYLKVLYEDTKKGQYFTDPAVVNFMLEQIGWTAESIKEKLSKDEEKISLIDPSCGSGTFLYSAVDTLVRTIGSDTEQLAKKIEELVNKNIFGLDIAEFPLYLAEMNILMRMLPLIINEKYNNPIDKKIKVFKTRDSIAEFMDTALRNTINDIDVAAQKNKGQGFLFKEELNLGYASYVRDEGDLKEMKDSLENRPRCPRRRFDFVIANPPYVGYNECSKQGVLIFDLLKKREAKLNNIYGVNLHSVPDRRKKYSPKPNLYAFFVALGLALLKDNAKLCYIIPKTILTAGDLDVLRYHLAKFTTIEKIITFSGKMFIGRGLKQDRPVATSSLILVVRRSQSNGLNQVEIINCKEINAEIEVILQSINSAREVDKKKITQGKLLENFTNWNFIEQRKSSLDFYDAYKQRTESIAAYYDHARAKHEFGHRFYFDIGFTLDPNEIRNKNDEDLYELLDFKTFDGYSRFTPQAYYPKDRKKIKLTQNNQGYITLESKYKIVWSVKNPDRFCFTTHPIIFYMGKAVIICSDHKREILYLFSLLNSAITRLVLTLNLKSENEKEYLIPIKAIKEFIKIPKVTETNQFLKDEIIKMAEEMLALEEIKLSDLVDFSEVMMQKFDTVLVKGNNLILCKEKKENGLKIKGDKNLVGKVMADKYGSKDLGFEQNKITLSELKTLPVIDFETQAVLKDYIDDLVFALYFNIPLTKVGFNHSAEIKERCQKDKFYGYIQKELTEKA